MYRMWYIALTTHDLLFKVGGARREIKPTLQVVVGTDLYMALKIGTDTKTVKRGEPPGGAGGAVVPSGRGAAGQRKR